MMSFKEWMVAEEARKVKPVDPDEVRLRAEIDHLNWPILIV